MNLASRNPTKKLSWSESRQGPSKLGPSPDQPEFSHQVSILRESAQPGPGLQAHTSLSNFSLIESPIQWWVHPSVPTALTSITSPPKIPRVGFSLNFCARWLSPFEPLLSCEVGGSFIIVGDSFYPYTCQHLIPQSHDIPTTLSVNRRRSRLFLESKCDDTVLHFCKT